MLGALLLHGSALLAPLGVEAAYSAPKRGDDRLVTVHWDVVPGERSTKAGGGTEQHEPAATAPRSREPVVAPPRARALVSSIAALETERVETPPSRLVTAEQSAEVVGATSLTEHDLEPALRPKPARNRLLAARDPIAAPGQGAGRREAGTGPGAGSGPGGSGRGAGGRIVRSAFAFGGPTGAFRAEVCFIPSPVRSLKEIRACEPALTFFTNLFHVPPRSFQEGFPGVTDRTEWFRIEYRGKFTVKVADYYKFRLLSDDGAILYIDGHEIIDNDGQHLPTSRATTITLEAGEHDLRLTYYQGPRDNLALQLFVTQYNHPERLFGPTL